jgi:hypothetical protein
MHRANSRDHCSSSTAASDFGFAGCNARATRFGALCSKLGTTLYGLTLMLHGCAGGAMAREPARPAPVLQPAGSSGPVVARRGPSPAERQKLPVTIVSPTQTIDVEELFVSGQTALRQGDYVQAAASFDRVVAHAEPGELLLHAMFQSALAHEAEGDRVGAAQRFDDIGRHFPASALAPEAWLRCMRLQLYTDNWQAAGEIARTYLERYPDSGPRAQIVADAARALALLAASQQERAEYFIAQGLAVVDRYGLDRAGRVPRDLAELYFALGEARRQRADAAQLDPDVHHFSASLERRCQLLLDAQSAYSDSMRAYDAHWSTLAGYRVGELYQRLHAELMRIPAPRAASARQQQLFEGAMRLRYTVLLRKASRMLDHTVALARRTGEDSEWVRRAEQSRNSIARALVDEQSALDRLPFSGPDLQRALDDLAARSTGPGAGIAPRAPQVGPARD